MIKVKLLLAIFLMLSSIYSLAQDAKDTEPEVLETITVTARKKQVDLQDAPIAVSAISGEDFEQANIVKLDNLNGFAPGLVISKNDGAGRVVSIRGVGWETAQDLASQPSVLIYVNGVYLANPLSMGLDLGEIERIEVLRGPQGTEFGQSATGGAINIITRQAEVGETSGAIGAEVGTDGLFKGEGHVNLGIGDTAGLRFSYQKYNRDGFAEIRGGDLDGYELDDADSSTGHIAFDWRPNDQLSVKLHGFWQDSDQNGAAQKHINDPNPDPRELTQDYPSTFALENTSFSAIIDWESESGIKIKSLTGVQSLEKRQSMDGDRLTEELTAVNLTGFSVSNFDFLPTWDNDSEAFSQEINISKDGNKLDWVVGAYYLDHENSNFFLELVGPGPVSQFDDQINNPGPETLPPFQAPLEFVEDRTLTREDTAIYGQLVYDFTDTWSVTLGGRFQNDESKDVATQFWFIESEQVLEDDAFTWKLGLDGRIDDDHLFYALISTGWKNGGNNPGALNGAFDVPINTKPEEVTAFELGSKNTFLNNRARFNITGFYYDYENYQFIQEDPVPFAAGSGNIPSVTIYGVESEFGFLMEGGWRLDGFVAAMDGEVKDDFFTLDVVDFLNSGFGRFLPTGIDDRASLRVNLKGNDPPKLVDLTTRLVLTNNHAFGNGSVLTSRFEYIYRGEYQYRVFNNPETDTVPSYNTFGVWFGYDFASMPLSLSLSGSNLFDEDGVNSRFTNPFGLHTTSEEFIPPREIIAAVKYSF